MNSLYVQGICCCILSCCHFPTFLLYINIVLHFFLFRCCCFLRLGSPEENRKHWLAISQNEMLTLLFAGCVGLEEEACVRALMCVLCVFFFFFTILLSSRVSFSREMKMQYVQWVELMTVAFWPDCLINGENIHITKGLGAMEQKLGTFTNTIRHIRTFCSTNINMMISRRERVSRSWQKSRKKVALHLT